MQESSESSTETEISEDALPEDDGKVDFEALPADIRPVYERRLNTMYGVTKSLRGDVEVMKNANKELLAEIKAIRDESRERDAATIQNQIKEAIEDGDSEKAATLTAKMADLKSTQSEPAPKEKAQEETAGDEPPDLSEIFTPEEEAEFLQWAMEEENGNRKRPWLDQNHPRNGRAVKVIEGVLADPEFEGKSLKVKGAEIDKLMGLQSKTQAAPVLNSGNPPRGATKTSLTADQKRAAELMGVSEKDYASAIRRDSSGGMIYQLEVE